MVSSTIAAVTINQIARGLFSLLTRSLNESILAHQRFDSTWGAIEYHASVASP
jgi:hypothetical protein